MTIQFNSKLYKVSQKKGRNLLSAKVRLPDGTRKELLAPTLTQLQEKANEIFGDTRTDTVGWYFEKVWAPTRKHLRRETQKKDVWAMTIILDRFGSSPLDEVTRADIQQFINGLKYEASTVRYIIYQRLANLFSLAMTDGYITQTPCLKIRLPRLKQERTCPLEIEHVQSAINSESRSARSVFRLLALGLRIGEAHGLTREHLKNNQLFIKQQRHDERIGELKTRGSERIIPIPESLANEILADSGDVYLAVNEDGTPQSHSRPSKLLKQICKDASPHDFRRFFVSYLENEMEVSRASVQNLVGHAGSSITDKYARTRIGKLSKVNGEYWDQISTPVRHQFGEQQENIG